MAEAEKQIDRCIDKQIDQCTGGGALKTISGMLLRRHKTSVHPL
jgi:hypothetical protein